MKQLVQAAVDKAVALEGIAFRATRSEYANRRDLLSGEGTRTYGGRWTPPRSHATVHASLDVYTAMAESMGTQEWYGISAAERLPLTLVAIDFNLQKILDLTDERLLQRIQVTRRQLMRCRWRQSADKGKEALTQCLGRIVFEAGLEGMLVPSARVRKGVNLLVFPQNIRPVSMISIRNIEFLPPIPG